MRPARRVVHCSDVHLDNDYYGGERNLDRRDYYRAVFGRLLDQIRTESPDLMLLAGDLFDSNRASEGTVQWAMRALESLPFPVVMIPGNHDCLAENAVFRRFDFNQLPNVDLITAEQGAVVDLDTLGVAVWGRGMVEHSPDNRPLEGPPVARTEGLWYLGLGHGIYVEAGRETLHSSPIHAEQIADAPFDYLALGHHHGVMDVSAGRAPAFYSGAPTPIVDDRGTYVVVDLDDERGTVATVRELS